MTGLRGKLLRTQVGLVWRKGCLLAVDEGLVGWKARLVGWKRRLAG